MDVYTVADTLKVLQPLAWPGLPWFVWDTSRLSVAGGTWPPLSWERTLSCLKRSPNESLTRALLNG